MNQAVGEKVPGNDAGHVKNEWGQVRRRQTSDLPENNHEHKGGQERLNKKPEGSEERLLVRGYEISFNQQQVQLTIRPELSRMAAQGFVSFDNIGGLPWFCAFAGASGQLRSQIDSSSLGVFGAGRLGHNSYRGVQNNLVPLCKAVSELASSQGVRGAGALHPLGLQGPSVYGHNGRWSPEGHRALPAVAGRQPISFHGADGAGALQRIGRQWPSVYGHNGRCR